MSGDRGNDPVVNFVAPQLNRQQRRALKSARGKFDSLLEDKSGSDQEPEAPYVACPPAVIDAVLDGYQGATRKLIEVASRFNVADEDYPKLAVIVAGMMIAKIAWALPDEAQPELDELLTRGREVGTRDALAVIGAFSRAANPPKKR